MPCDCMRFAVYHKKMRTTLRSLLVLLLWVACSKAPIDSAQGLTKDATVPPDSDSASAADLAPPDTREPCAFTTAEACPGAACAFPLDWQSAQQPSAWCQVNDQYPPASISLCRTGDGYDLVWTAYDMGGEFFLYDPVTGAFVQRRADAKALYACEIGVPGGPAMPQLTCAGPESVFPVVCPAPGSDAGSLLADGGLLDGAAPTLPACAWPKIDQGDASPGQCRVDRTLLSCILEDGSTEICTSSNLANCPDQSSTMTQLCIDQCGAGEYAVVCGSPGPSAMAFEPPVALACHATLYTPGGVVFYCCPCP